MVPEGAVQPVRAERPREGVTLNGAAETLGKTRSLESREDSESAPGLPVRETGRSKGCERQDFIWLGRRGQERQELGMLIPGLLPTQQRASGPSQFPQKTLKE